MSKILALDLSTKRSGWAFKIDNQAIQYGAISSSSTSVEKRITIMRDEIIKIIQNNNIEEVIIEEVRPDGTNNHTGKVLTWLQGCIAVAIYEYNKNIKINFIGPSSWRSVLGIQGYRIKREQQKIKDIEYAKAATQAELTLTQDDEADAICILLAYLKDKEKLNIQEIKEKLPAIGDSKSAF